MTEDLEGAIARLKELAERLKTEDLGRQPMLELLEQCADAATAAADALDRAARASAQDALPGQQDLI